MSFARHVFFMNQIYLININSFPNTFLARSDCFHRNSFINRSLKNYHDGKRREQGSDRLDTEERKELNDSDFGLPEERKYPMPDATHVRAAESYFRYATDQQKPELAH